jgi:hypothetical protein
MHGKKFKMNYERSKYLVSILFCWLLSITIVNGYASSNDIQRFSHEKGRHLYAFTINELKIKDDKKEPSQYKIIVQVKSPKGFQGGYNKTEYNRIRTELVPEGEAADNWSKLVTMIYFPNIRKQSSFLVSQLKNDMRSSIQSLKGNIDISRFPRNIKLINQDLVPDKVYKKEGFLAKYSYIQANNKTNEFVAILYLSGSDDAISIQYAVKLNKTMTEDKAKKLAVEFFNKNVLLMIV